MSLINADLLRGLGSGRGRQSSCLSQCMRVLAWDPGRDGRAGPPTQDWGGGFTSRRYGGVQAAVHPRRGRSGLHQHGREAAHSSLGSCSSLEISWLSEEKSRS